MIRLLGGGEVLKYYWVVGEMTAINLIMGDQDALHRLWGGMKTKTNIIIGGRDLEPTGKDTVCIGMCFVYHQLQCSSTMHATQLSRHATFGKIMTMVIDRSSLPPVENDVFALFHSFQPVCVCQFKIISLSWIIVYLFIICIFYWTSVKKKSWVYLFVTLRRGCPISLTKYCLPPAHDSLCLCMIIDNI